MGVPKRSAAPRGRSAPAIVRHGAGLRESGALFGLVVGILIGVLVTALVRPAQRDVASVSGSESGTFAGSSEELGEAVLDGLDGEGAVTSSGPGATRARSGGRVAASATPGARAGGGSASASAPAAPKTSARGVSDDAITIGIALLDTGALGAAEQYNYGEPEDHYDAVLAAWEREGKRTVHGRKIQFVYRRYDVLSPEDQRAACVNLIQDRKAFMVVGTVYFRVGGDCVTVEHKTPMLTSDALNETILARGHPYAFSLATSDDRVGRNLVQFAHRRKLITGPIGIYYEDTPENRDLIQRNFKEQLGKLGYEVAAEATTDTGFPSANDALAVRRFQQEGVEVAFIFAARDGFTQQAEAQGYEPRYIDSDFMYGTTDANTANANANQYAGTLAISGRRGGEQAAGLPLTREQQWCKQAYEEHTGVAINDRNSFRFQMAMHSCDSANTVRAAIERAGPGLTNASFIAGLESLKDVPLARSADLTFGPSKHHGADRFRTLEWQASCRCWKALSDFRPYYVP